MLRQRMRCDAPPFSPADYDFIMQRRDDRPRSKVLNELKEKYSTSQKRIYQIWRGEEKNRVAWDQPIFMPISDGPLPVVTYDPASIFSTINKQNDRRKEVQNACDSAITAMENVVHEAGAEPSKSTDSASDSKAKKTGGRKSRSKSIHASDPISSTESSEDVLDLYKRTSPEIEKIRASGRSLISK
jgi:hypothetical protein